MHSFSFSMEPGEKTCLECKKYFETDFRFCPKCGWAITDEMRNGSFGDLLQQEVFLPRLIYNKLSGDEYCQFKFGDLFRENGNFNLSNFVQLCYTKKQSFLMIGKNSYSIKKTYLNQLDKYFKDVHRTHLYDYRNFGDTLQARLDCKNAITELTKIKHTYLPARCVNTDIETLKNLLIVLIENNISEPIFGDRFVLIPDKQLKYPSGQHQDYWKDPENYKRDVDKIIKFTPLDIMELEFADEEKGKKDQYRDEIKEYVKMQEDIENLLRKINYDIYYSSRYQEFYLKSDLEKLLSKDIAMLGFKIDEHCKLFKIKHIKVYILNEEIDDLFEIGEVREQIERIKAKFGGGGLSMLGLEAVYKSAPSKEDMSWKKS